MPFLNPTSHLPICQAQRTLTSGVHGAPNHRSPVGNNSRKANRRHVFVLAANISYHMTPIFWTNSRDLKPATTSVCACPWSLFPGQRPGPPCHSPQISHQQFFNLSCYCLDMQYTEGTIVSSSINFLACVDWLAL